MTGLTAVTNKKGLRRLSVFMKKAAIAIEKDINVLVQDIAIEVHGDVAKATPVDEGVARSNWYVSLGAGPTPFIPAYSPYFARRYGGPGGSIRESRNLARARAQAISVIERRQTDVDINLTNVTPYIGALNRGHSSQAPSGFVQRGIKSGLARALKNFRFRNTERLNG